MLRLALAAFIWALSPLSALGGTVQTRYQVGIYDTRGEARGSREIQQDGDRAHGERF